MASESVQEVNVCVSTADTSGLLKKEETTLREWVVKNQIGPLCQPSRPVQVMMLTEDSRVLGISLTILTMIFAVHNLYPSLRPYTMPFLQLPHYDTTKGAYVQGWNDIYFIISSILAFTAVRAIVIDWIFEPIARNKGLKRKPAIRFAEQAWLLVYDSTFWSYGMVRTLAKRIIGGSFGQR